MLRALVICGASNSGKTTLIEILVRRLTDLGIRTGTLKADGHGKAEAAVEGKDTTRHLRAGALKSVLLSPGMTSTFEDGPVQHIHAVEERFAGCDVVLLEGFRDSPLPKIEVVRKAISAKPMVPHGELLGIYGDVPVEGLRHFPGPDSLVDFIRSELVAPPGSRVALRVDGKRVPLKAHLQEIVAGVVEGAVGSLKGCEKARTIEMVVRDDDR